MLCAITGTLVKKMIVFFFFCVLVKWWKVLSFAMSYQSSVIPLSDSVAECHFSLSYRYYGK